ncbi:hypothetical protein [Chondromyces apiculatus]|uniref:Yip1 domain-containing protein n=1 Tax=Chondromyces apiculatus DSM 436 TaxID=1192034 RepID=A0A017TFU8_9BACT|nr:hypothetical protein [Chondromyces apiculatus]EYF07481.1 Hypothetical protein CAP_0234 [Chondromyces apiculatus DSM 436]
MSAQVHAARAATAPSLDVLSRLLRDPAGVAQRCREEDNLGQITATALVAITLGAAVFGGVIGSFRGGVQIGYAAIKIPLALLATLALCTPGFHAFSATLGRAFPLRSVVSLSLAAAARAALVLLASAPVLWLMFDLGLDYHQAALAAAFAYGLAGLAALGVLLRGLGAGKGRVLTALGFVALFFAVAGQTSWILRPYLVRPRTESPPFLRAREGGFGDAVLKSGRSSMGIFDEDLTTHEHSWEEDSYEHAPAAPRSPEPRTWPAVRAVPEAAVPAEGAEGAEGAVPAAPAAPAAPAVRAVPAAPERQEGGL